MKNNNIFRNMKKKNNSKLDRIEEDRDYVKRLYNYLEEMKNFYLKAGVFKGKIHWQNKLYTLLETEEFIKGTTREETSKEDNSKVFQKKDATISISFKKLKTIVQLRAIDLKYVIEISFDLRIMNLMNIPENLN